MTTPPSTREMYETAIKELREDILVAIQVSDIRYRYQNKHTKPQETEEEVKRNLLGIYERELDKTPDEQRKTLLLEKWMLLKMHLDDDDEDM